jgi:flagellar basal body rod protein FlgG
MDSISISAASGMRARMESLDLLANNLANAETGGYKADREFYSLFTGADATSDPSTGDLTTLPVVEKHWTDLSQGDFHVTGNPLDFAVDGDGLFALQTPRGVRYTRNGNFRISAAGILSTNDGSTVRSRTGGPIQLQAGLPIDVQSDGTVLQGGTAAGQIEVASFDPGTLNKEGASYWAPLAGAVPKPAKGVVLQGKLEASNVGTAESAVRLVAIMRQFEMLQKAMTIGNDLNQRAIQEVARVNT